jgi:5'-nucleotidase
MEPRIILVDLDNTVADWSGRFSEGLTRLRPDLAPQPPDRFSVWSDDVDRNLAIQEVVREPGFYAQLPTYPGARNALIGLLHAGVGVFIVSTPMESNVTSASDKSAWVRTHLGRRFVNRLILSHDKSLVRGDLLIDDKPRISGLMEPTWRQVYFDQPYNRPDAEGNPTTTRVHIWDEWPTLLDLL